MVHSTLSTHSEAIPQSRIVTQLYPKTGTRLESGMQSFEVYILLFFDD